MTVERRVVKERVAMCTTLNDQHTVVGMGPFKMAFGLQLLDDLGQEIDELQ